MNYSRYSTVILLLLFCALFGCSTDKPAAFSYAYEIDKYYGDPADPKNYRSTSYYSTDDMLLRTAGSEIGCTDFIYDDSGKLMEKQWSRNCTHVNRREFMIYDDSGNLLGSYPTRDSLVNLDTVSYEQVFFYDEANRLVQERIQKFTNSDGEKLETWRHYKYDGEKVKEEVTTFNGNTIWNGVYVYNAEGKLSAIHRTRASLTEDEFFIYDAGGKLLEKRISSTENPVRPETSFSADNNRRVYEYESDNFLGREIIYNHKNKRELVINYIKTNKRS
ncbi:hypothetical protein D770_04775 [Flammeovirgaceae bacterium 311]|nr:hypothetical protein D770_04775 [Flammeovirgaceae bacterium 311]